LSEFRNISYDLRDEICAVTPNFFNVALKNSLSKNAMYEIIIFLSFVFDEEKSNIIILDFFNRNIYNFHKKRAIILLIYDNNVYFFDNI